MKTNLIPGSVTFTSPKVKVLSEAQFLAGECAKGTIVILEPETEPKEEVTRAIKDREAVGFISDFTPLHFERPDEVPEIGQLDVTGLVGIAISPREAMPLRTLASKGGLFVEIAANGAIRVWRESLAVPSVGRDPIAPPRLNRAEIVQALAEVGVKKGDILLMHSSLKACGYIEGGARTVLESVMEAVGENGTVLMPSFLKASAYLNGINKQWAHRPSDLSDAKSAAMKWIGVIPMQFLQLFPEKAVRGKHLTHPWCGWGPLAAEMTGKQQPCDPPAGETSALAAAVEKGAKILHFGSPMGHTTFLHYLETKYDLPGLGPMYVEVKRADGYSDYAFIPKHLPGPREFYVKNEDARFFREAIAKGLQVNKTPLGSGFLRLMDCRQLFEIGSELVKADRNIIVGDLG